MTNLTSVIWNRLWRSRNINENMYTFWSARSLRSCLLKRILFITYGSSSQWLLIPLKIVFKCAKNATFKFYTLNLEKGPCRGREDTPLPHPPPVGRLLRSLAEDLRQNDFVPPSRFCPSNTQSVPARLMAIPTVCLENGANKFEVRKKRCRSLPPLKYQQMARLECENAKIF